MIRIRHGDLLLAGESHICHQVNCMGVMGSGVAKQIRAKWPVVYTKYKGLCDAIQPGALLGCDQIVEVGNGKHVCNLFGQLNYGRDKSAYTNIYKLRHACEHLVACASPEAAFAMPYRIGCGLGGGDWGKVLDMLTEAFADRELTLYKVG